jgi:uncharacterized membrane protein
MANTVIAASFDSETAAFETAHEIQDLDRSGAVKVRRGAIVTKDRNGDVTILDSSRLGGPWGVVGGALIGALIGLLLGPAAWAIGGAVAGASVGTAGSTLSSLMEQGTGRQFLEDVGSKIEPGQTVVLAELEEGSTEQLDNAVTRRGGHILRSNG